MVWPKFVTVSPFRKVCFMKFITYITLMLFMLLSVNAQYHESYSGFRIDVSVPTSDGDYFVTCTSNDGMRSFSFLVDGRKNVEIVESYLDGHSVSFGFIKDSQNISNFFSFLNDKAKRVHVTKSFCIPTKNKTLILPDKLEIITGLDLHSSSDKEFMSMALERYGLVYKIDGALNDLSSGGKKLDPNVEQHILDLLSRDLIEEFSCRVKREHPFKATISLLDFVDDSQAMVEFKVANTSKKDLYFCKKNTPFGMGAQLTSNCFRVYNQRGFFVKFLGHPPYEPKPLDDSDMILIKAGKSISRTVDIKFNYDMSYDGTYHIKYCNNFLHFSEQKSISGIDYKNTPVMHSNTLVVNIKDE